MKHCIALLFFLLSFQNTYPQLFADGPANMRTSPNGKIALSVENNVPLFVLEQPGDWAKISLQGLIKTKSFNGKTITKGTQLFNDKLTVIANTQNDFELTGYSDDSPIEGYIRLYMQLYTHKNNIKELSYDELLAEKEAIFNDSDEARILIYRENGIEYIHKTEVNYSYDYVVDGTNFTRYLTKTKTVNKNTIDTEGTNTSVTLTFYPEFSEKGAFSYTKDVDRFELFDNFLIAAKYGCCGAEDYYELSDFPDNNTFLQFSSHYYIIEVPNSPNTVLFGFNVESRYEDLDALLLGELNYSVNHKKSGKVKFYAANKTDFENIAAWTPEIELISKSGKDEIRKYPEFSRLTAWSHDQLKDVSRLNDLGLKISFADEQSGKTRKYYLMLKNGMLSEKSIIVNFE